MILGVYDSRIAVVTGRTVPPAASWWVGLTREQFMVAAQRERPRLCHRDLSPGVSKALAELEAERRRKGAQ